MKQYKNVSELIDEILDGVSDCYKAEDVLDSVELADCEMTERQLDMYRFDSSWQSYASQND